MRAGTASITTVEGSGAVPAGAYRPTAPIGRISRSQRTPGMVSTARGITRCAAWNACTLAMARSSAACCSGVNARRAAVISAALTANSSKST